MNQPTNIQNNKFAAVRQNGVVNTFVQADHLQVHNEYNVNIQPADTAGPFWQDDLFLLLACATVTVMIAIGAYITYRPALVFLCVTAHVVYMLLLHRKIARVTVSLTVGKAFMMVVLLASEIIFSRSAGLAEITKLFRKNFNIALFFNPPNSQMPYAIVLGFAFLCVAVHVFFSIAFLILYGRKAARGLDSDFTSLRKASVFVDLIGFGAVSLCVYRFFQIAIPPN